MADIPDLVEHILDKFRSRLGRDVRRDRPRGPGRLRAYAWPGNIRELENLLERTVLFCEGARSELEDLPDHLRELDDRGRRRVPQLPCDYAAPRDNGASLKEIVRAETERVERDLILAALEETGGNVTHAAKRLKISRKSLQIKMKELGLRDRQRRRDRQKG